MSPHDVVDYLVKGVVGQIVACNIIASLREGLVERDMVVEMFEALSRFGKREGFRESTDVVSGLLELRDGERSDIDPAGVVATMRLRGIRPEADDDLRGNASIVMPASTARRLLGPSEDDAMAHGLKLVASTTDPESDENVAYWQGRESEKRRWPMDPNTKLGRPREVLWFVRRDDLKAGLGGVAPREQGQRAHEYLGLARRIGEVLVAVHFPADAIAQSVRPTFFDGINHRRYRAWPDGALAQKDRTWGRTVDLLALQNRASSMDGAPERVAQPFRPPGMIEFEMLGRVERHSGGDSRDDATFANRLALEQGTTVAGLATSLKSVI